LEGRCLEIRRHVTRALVVLIAEPQAHLLVQRAAHDVGVAQALGHAGGGGGGVIETRRHELVVERRDEHLNEALGTEACCCWWFSAFIIKGLVCCLLRVYGSAHLGEASQLVQRPISPDADARALAATSGACDVVCARRREQRCAVGIDAEGRGVVAVASAPQVPVPVILSIIVGGSVSKVFVGVGGGGELTRAGAGS